MKITKDEAEIIIDWYSACEGEGMNLRDDEHSLADRIRQHFPEDNTKQWTLDELETIREIIVGNDNPLNVINEAIAKRERQNS